MELWFEDNITGSGENIESEGESFRERNVNQTTHREKVIYTLAEKMKMRRAEQKRERYFYFLSMEHASSHILFFLERTHISSSWFRFILFTTFIHPFLMRKHRTEVDSFTSFSCHRKRVVLERRITMKKLLFGRYVHICVPLLLHLPWYVHV